MKKALSILLVTFMSIAGIFLVSTSASATTIPKTSKILDKTATTCVAAGSPYKDIKKDSSICNYALWLYQNNFFRPSGIFDPSKPVTRAKISIVTYRMINTAAPEKCSRIPFMDVSNKASNCGFIKWMDDHDILKGYKNWTFNPNDVLSRKDFALILTRLVPDAKLSACKVKPYKDVDVKSSICPAITWLKTNKIISGYPNGTFGLEKPVTRNTMAVFLNRISKKINQYSKTKEDTSSKQVKDSEIELEPTITVKTADSSSFLIGYSKPDENSKILTYFVKDEVFNVQKIKGLDFYKMLDHPIYIKTDELVRNKNQIKVEYTTELEKTILKTVKTLPDKGRTMTLPIRILPEGTAKDAWGITIFPSCQIYVSQFTPRNLIKNVVYHEYGHELQCRAYDENGTLLDQALAEGNSDGEKMADTIAGLLGTKQSEMGYKTPTKWEIAAGKKIIAGNRI